MKKYNFKALGLSALCILTLADCKQKEEEEKPLILEVTSETQEVPGEMAEYVEPVVGNYKVTFTPDEATVELDVETLAQARYTEDADLELTILDQNMNPLGDYAVMGLANPKDFDKMLTEEPSKSKLKFTTSTGGNKLTEEQINSMKEKGKYLRIDKAEGVHTWYFTGCVGGKYPIHMTLSSDLTEGSYYYDKSGVNNPMWLTVDSYDNENGKFVMTERNAQGMMCGYWEGSISPENYNGTCTITISGKEYDCVLPRYKEKPKEGLFSPAKQHE